MANIFTNEKVNEDYFGMSNGLTSVFIETICLAGIENAREDYEKDLLIWFGQRDWTLLGMGIEGFDISEIIWDAGNFDKQKAFVLATIEGVFQEKNWNLLSYTPNREWLFEKLLLFKKMIGDYTSTHIDKEAQFEIFEFGEGMKKYDTCEIHKVYKHIGGCVICNNL
jgi:hypothetical protein